MSDGQSNLREREVEQLRAELRFIQQRLSSISHRVDSLAAPAPMPVPPPPLPVTPPPVVAETVAPRPVTVVELPPVIEAPPVLPLSFPSAPPPPEPEVPRESFEVRLGTVWLPRIGMALLLFGMAFFVKYWVPRMTVGHKVALAYLLCGVLGGIGWRLEKRMEQLALILETGALGLLYFVTYGLYHFPAFRLIQNPGIDLALLSVVVAGIVFFADRRRSAWFAGMALLFGYLTTIISDVAPFTLAANAVLAVGALWFLARNRWVGIAYGAVLATYLAYALWVWRLDPWGDLRRLIWSTSYLDEATFRLRAAFLCLYWVLFTVGGLLVRRAACAVGERNGLLTLNNAFFFILFSLLVHHAHPGQQWVFQFGFGGALLIASAIAYQRYQPERVLMDALFLQGLAVATLGLISKLKGVNLVASLAVESLFLLWLARAMDLRWIAWLGRLVFGIAAGYAWSRLPRWSDPMIFGVVFAGAAGLMGARLTKAVEKPLPVSLGALYYAIVSVVLAMTASSQYFEAAALPWVWLVLAVVVMLVGILWKTRETVWLGNLPLVWAHLTFHLGNFGAVQFRWTVAQGLALIAVTLGLGLVWWGRARANGNDTRASESLMPYALAGTLAVIGLTVEQCPDRLVVATLGVEAVVLLMAGLRLNEPTLRWLAVLPLAWAHGMYFPHHKTCPFDQSLALVALTLGCGLLFWAREQNDETETETEPDRLARAPSVLWPFALAAVSVAVIMTLDYVPKRFQLPVFAGQGALLVFAGLPVFRTLSAVPFVLGTLAFMGLRKFQVGPLAEAWLSMGLGWLFLVLAARVLRLRAVGADRALRLRAGIIGLATVVVVFGLHKLVEGTLLTVAWAGGGFVMLALGFAVRERPYRIAGLVVLGFSLVRVIGYDLAKVETIYRILAFIGLGVILLLLAFLYTKNRERVAKWL